jgi:hypothetical protein
MSEQSDKAGLSTERLDQALTARLGRLRTMPVEIASLRQAITTLVPPPPRSTRSTWPHPLGAIAAGLLVIGAVAAVILFWAGQPVLASPRQLAALHEHNVSGPPHSTPVSSFDAAHGLLSRQWPGAPALPKLEQGQVTSCCMHHIGRKKVACVCLQVDGTPVSLVVADARELDVPASSAISVNGVTYQLHSSDGVNMLLAEHGGRWVCIMGRLPAQRLTSIAGSLRF